LALIAGEGRLPKHVLSNALKAGWRVSVAQIGQVGHGWLFKQSALVTLPKALKAQCVNVETFAPGLVEQNFRTLNQWGVTHLVFAGKVNKWMLMLDLRLDPLALSWLNSVRAKNDDALMLSLIEAAEAQGFKILPQTAFLQSLLLPEGQLSERPLTEQEQLDAQIGFKLAKTMGQLDVGQTVVVHNGMVLAVEAIEGTDECLKRAGKLARGKGGVVVKVAKPGQDQRFDVPAVGLRTLKTMQKAGLKALVTEAEQTLYLDEPEAMQAFSDKAGLGLSSKAPQPVKHHPTPLNL
jgi:DUF1009 family protein